MNWTFYSAENRDVASLIQSCSEQAAETLERWIKEYEPEVEKQPEAWYTEFPNGFCRDLLKHPFAYRYTITTGFYKNGKYYRLGPVPYNITVERATPADYAHECGVEFDLGKRVRYINNVPPIV